MSVCCLWDAILICKILVDPASLKHCTAVALPLLMCCYHLSESVGPLTIAVLVFYDTYMWILFLVATLNQFSGLYKTNKLTHLSSGPVHTRHPGICPVCLTYIIWARQCQLISQVKRGLRGVPMSQGGMGNM